MRKITIIALALVILSCEKNKEVVPEFPVKFLPTAYSNGYMIKLAQNPQVFPHDFTALPSISQGNDVDYYECQFYAKQNLDSLLFKYNISVRPTDAREKKGTFTMYRNFVSNYNVVYYRIIRVEDSKTSEVRMLNFNFR